MYFDDEAAYKEIRSLCTLSCQLCSGADAAAAAPGCARAAPAPGQTLNPPPSRQAANPQAGADLPVAARAEGAPQSRPRGADVRRVPGEPARVHRQAAALHAADAGSAQDGALRRRRQRAGRLRVQRPPAVRVLPAPVLRRRRAVCAHGAGPLQVPPLRARPAGRPQPDVLPRHGGVAGALER